jgi:lambda repressor-like predicted transcriptional regulator
MDDPFTKQRNRIWEAHIQQGERQRELEHERQLAAIRAQSHAFVWTGTAEELIATITKWYESGRIVAESLQDALQKAAIHFLRPDGTPAMVPTVLANAAPSKPVAAQQAAAETTEDRRRAFVIPLLENKGWSILDWATESDVSHATAIDYLQGKTRPYSSTRMKLAKSLGVPVGQLPR